MEYKQLSQEEHVLLRPEMYMGEMKLKKSNEIVFDGTKLTKKIISYSCGLLKIFDEVLTNATDNIKRHNLKNGQIEVNIDENEISIANNGPSIPIKLVKNSKNEEIYLPQMLFGEFRSSSNYEDDKKRNFNGCNGIGVKLTNIFSKHFTVIIVNGNKKYQQKYLNNMKIIEKPIIKDINHNENHQKDLVYIRFQPDYEKFGIKTLDEDNKFKLFTRVYNSVLFDAKIALNGKILPHLSFKDYCLHELNGLKFEIPNNFVLYESREYKLFYISSSKPYVKSFINSIETNENGDHVNNFFKQLDLKLQKEIKIKERKSKNYSILFIDYNSLNPKFTSQAKTKFTSNETMNFSNVITEIIKKTNIKELMGSKINLPKTVKNKNLYFDRLDDANFAGVKSSECTLFVCEGLSAASMVSSGFGVLNHDYYGIFSLTGKILNVSKATNEQIENNIVISQLIQTLGLNPNEPENYNNLRYEKIVCMKDADVDGSAIMGLLINLFSVMFPKLAKTFLYEFITPQVQVINDKNEKIEFYNQVEFEKWKEKNKIKSIKFIKGLASNSSEDTLRYFKNFNDYLIPLHFDERSNFYLKMAYGEKTQDIENRKIWVKTCNDKIFLPRIKNTPIKISDFIMKDLILYSYDSCVRAIPNIYDGLKPTQRKILYTLLELNNDAYKLRKVFELAAKTAEKTQYHHGDSSLNSTIMKMMQTYCGSNNLPLLGHDGFIGSRFKLGQDGGAPRYVYVKLNEISRLIFPKIDDNLLTENYEDGIKVEPKYYIPIIPMVLINGACGIGTGFSTSIPLFNPIEIIDYMISNVENRFKTPMTFNLFYPNFKGSFEKNKKGYKSKGCFDLIDPSKYKNIFFKSKKIYDKEIELSYDYVYLLITEIPISNKPFYDSITKLKNIICENIKKKEKKITLDYLIDLKNNSITGNDSQKEKIELYLKFENNGIMDFKTIIESLKEVIKMEETVSLDNMYLFDSNSQINKYETINEIFSVYASKRFELYQLRKEKIINENQNELISLENKSRFIQKIINNELNVKENYCELRKKMETFNFIDIKQLLNIPIKSLTRDEQQKLEKEIVEKHNELEKIKNKKIEIMWKEELINLKKYLE